MPLRAILDIGRGRYVIADYRVGRDQWQRLGKERLVTPEGVTEGIRERTLFAGEVDEELRDTIVAALDSVAVLVSPAARLRRAGFLAELAWQRLQRGERDDPASLAPVYIHTQPVAQVTTPVEA
jgi:tRNA threonylcarbamoyladenosine biosynthesis protein TsaB